MKLISLKDEKELSVYAANLVIDRINQNPQSVIVFPTGNTPLGMFDQLVTKYRDGKVIFRDVCLIELDEYFGISLDDSRNLFNWLNRSFIQKVDLVPQNVFRFNSNAQYPEKEIKRIDQLIEEKNGIDLIVLGLGTNGHVGFNEPGSQATSHTRVVKLSPDSLQSNSRYWDENSLVPSHGFTLGMETIMKSREIILLVQGEQKAGILKEVINSPISDQIPATFLRTVKNFTILADRAAASLINCDTDSLT